ncbi:hypothetical protein RN2511_014790 [Rhodococcus sp. NKCM2511]|uniref:hypothetical protein n=1 Tax=Rhodococcus sp. NKCM2511 TaxID=2766011 RepID=UPI001910D596|nr:hypothetical protein [Rhodococcus sp. NKCM2511]GHP16743.1 hypothetical protein RN2511_014790 [Rhodococcus sp. NKCM2511]
MSNEVDVTGGNDGVGGTVAKSALEPETAPAPLPGNASDYLIGLAQVHFEGLDNPDSVSDAVKQSWTAGGGKILYGRRWTITKIIEDTGNGYFGKLGFVREDEISTVMFDEEVKDFIQGSTSSGVVVPFFLTTSGQLAYQLLSGTVRETTFLRAFSEIINQGAQLFDWILTPISIEIDYANWVTDIAKVSRFDFTLERPNPHYHDDDLVERIVEETEAEYIRLTGQAQSGKGLNTDSDAFKQALDHVSRNYGRATITGSDQSNNETVWTKPKNSTARTLARVKVPSLGPGAEAPLEALRIALTRVPAGAQAVDLDQSDDEALES